MSFLDLTTNDDLSGFTLLWKSASIEGYRYELYSGNRVLVYKGDSSVPNYEITELGCSCRAAQYGNTNCKHRAMFSWVGDGARAGNASHQKRDNAERETSTTIDNLL